MEEITLTELLIKTRNYIKKYWLALVILTVIGGILGFVKYKKEKAFYYTEVYVSTGLTTSNNLTDINSLYAELDEISKNITNTAWVKENLDIENSSFKSLRIIVPDYRKTYQKINIIKIKISSYNKEDIEKIKTGLIYYFENKSPLYKIYQERRLAKEKALDNWKTFIKNQNSINIGEATYKIYKELNNKQPILFYTSTFSTPKTIHPSKKTLTIYAIAFLFLGIIITLGIETIKYINNVEKE